MVDKEDNKDVLIDPSTLVMIGVDGKILSTDYTLGEDGMVYHDECDETEFILISDEVKESKIKKNARSGGQVPKRE